jgi:hypothetical protein
MQFNLFQWIREGVKQSVILGVHDAMDAIGSPEGDNARERLAALLPPAEPAAVGTIGAAGKRKRLGRSLRDFDESAE